MGRRRTTPENTAPTRPNPTRPAPSRPQPTHPSRPGPTRPAGGVLYIPEDPWATGGQPVGPVSASHPARRPSNQAGGNAEALRALVDQRIRNSQPRMAQRAR